MKFKRTALATLLACGFAANVLAEKIGDAPEDFTCIWEKGTKTTFSWHAENLSTKESVERLFVFRN